MVMLASAGPSGGMGRTIAAAGLGQLVGPGFAGLTADAAGPWLPFTVIAAVAVPLAFLLRHVSDARASDAAERGLRSTVLAMRREPRVIGAILVVALLGFASSVTNLVVPLHLRDHGLSAGDIGLLLTAAAVVWVVAAPLAGRVPERRVGTVLVGLSTAIMGAIWLLPIGSPSVLAIAAFLVLSSACRAPLNTFVYVFGRRAATGTGVAPGSYVGVMNVAWAVAAVAGPVMAGAALASGGPRWPYIIVAVPGRARRRVDHHPGPGGAEDAADRSLKAGPRRRASAGLVRSDPSTGGSFAAGHRGDAEAGRAGRAKPCRRRVGPPSSPGHLTTPGRGRGSVHEARPRWPTLLRQDRTDVRLSPTSFSTRRPSEG
jgi:MFS family permease